MIIVGVMFSHLPAGAMKRARGVEGDAMFALRCSTHQIRVYFWTQYWVPRGLEANLLFPYSVLLGCEGRC